MAGPSFTVTSRDRGALRQACDTLINRVADDIRHDAVQETPVDSGQMADSWRLIKGQIPAKYYVVNDAPHAKAVEFGNRGRPPRAPLGRALARWRVNR